MKDYKLSAALSHRLGNFARSLKEAGIDERLRQELIDLLAHAQTEISQFIVARTLDQFRHEWSQSLATVLRYDPRPQLTKGQKT